MAFTLQKHWNNWSTKYIASTIPHHLMRNFAGQKGSLTLKSLYANAQGIQNYSINLLLYLRTVKYKYVLLYKELTIQVHIYAAAIRILAKGYLPISLITPLKLKKILNKVRNTVRKTNPDYDLFIKRLHPYYEMKLVTFGIDDNKKSNSTGPSIHTAIYTATTDTISNRDHASTNSEQEYTGIILHTSVHRQIIHCTEFRNIYYIKAAGTKDM